MRKTNLAGPIKTFVSALLTVTMPAAALSWEAGFENGLCTLTHTEAEADVRLTFDPKGPLYAITLTRPTPWPAGPVFSLLFQGGTALRISTDRHSLSNGDRSLTVTDRGFGNVLSGLAQNTIAVGQSGTGSIAFSLEGAAPEVAAFEACATAPTA